MNFLDRSILNILAQSIKEDLGLTDTQLGLMGGLAFAVFYTFLGIPIARLADRTVRRNVLAVCLALWSVMTVLCGMAQNFWHLLLGRIGVAVGEAGGSPPCHSMISDFFPEHQRATALGIYSLGVAIGSALGYLFGGILNDLYGWRIAFIAVGVPGIFCALLVRFTLREPVRGGADLEARKSAQAEDMPTIPEAFALLWARRSFRYLSVGSALHAFVGYGVALWVPPMFERSHGLTSSTIGLSLFLLGFAGMLGTFLGGWLSDRMGTRDKRWYVWIPGYATLLSVPFAAFTYLHSQPYTAFIVYAIPVMLGFFYLGPTFSLTQSLASVRSRALAASILLFVLNIIGLGLGPLFVGAASDFLNAYTDLGQESLRYALVITLLFNVLSTLCYLLAGRNLRHDLKQSPTGSPAGNPQEFAR